MLIFYLRKGGTSAFFIPSCVLFRQKEDKHDVLNKPLHEKEFPRLAHLSSGSLFFAFVFKLLQESISKIECKHCLAARQG
jgi:hypothetical protein